jgi:hypothetical protein
MWRLSGIDFAFTHHTSHVTRHTPHVTRHTSHVTRHTRSSDPPPQHTLQAKRFPCQRFQIICLHIKRHSIGCPPHHIGDFRNTPAARWQCPHSASASAFHGRQGCDFATLVSSTTSGKLHHFNASANYARVLTYMRMAPALHSFRTSARSLCTDVRISSANCAIDLT